MGTCESTPCTYSATFGSCVSQYGCLDYNYGTGHCCNLFWITFMWYALAIFLCCLCCVLLAMQKRKRQMRRAEMVGALGGAAVVGGGGFGRRNQGIVIGSNYD